MKKWLEFGWYLFLFLVGIGGILLSTQVESGSQMLLLIVGGGVSGFGLAGLSSAFVPSPL